MQDLSCAPALCIVHVSTLGIRARTSKGCKDLPKISADIDEVMRRYGPSNDNCYTQVLNALSGKVGF
jgi:hypothetical protein